jgi:transposase
MFIRRTKGGSKEKPVYYLQLVHSYRDCNGKPRHKIICNLGREEELLNKAVFDDLVKKFSRFAKNVLVFDKERDKVGKTYLFGGLLAVEAVWKKAGLDKIFEGVKKKYKIEFDLESVVKLMILNRLIQPKSKLSIMKWKEKIKDEKLSNIKLQYLYRALDILAEHKGMLEEQLLQSTYRLFKPSVKLLFYDLTTIYFESQREDVLRKFGYSKENKTDCVQIVLALTVNEDNIPLGYEIFPGNTFEGKTVKVMLSEIRQKFQIEKVIIVGDKGILSREVLMEIEENGYEYIVASKLSSLPQKYHEEILNKASYRAINEDLSIKEIQLEGRRLVLGFSEERAQRDSLMRQRILQKIQKKLETDPKGLAIKPAYRKYLSLGEMEIGIDMEKINTQMGWDGHFGFITNNKEITSEQVIGTYKMLWQIEESFRTLKSTLDIRPVYHWSERRIRGHIMMCFLSFYLMRVMQKILQDCCIELSHEEIMDNLNEIRLIEMQTEGRKILMRTEIEGINNKILRALGVKIPSFIVREDVVE